MGSNSQQYCLRWNNHRSNLLTVFDELLQNEAFTDVTLVCESGSPIKCHRMVLAACSPYFQNLFTDLPCKHPVVVLKDVKYVEIKAILEYMYRGEVNVAQDQLAALLRVAEALKVKGLMEENRPKSEAPPMPETDAGISPSSTNNQTTVHSSSNVSPPHSTNEMQYKNPYIYGKSPSMERSTSRMNIPMWSVPGLPMSHHPSQVQQQQNHPHSAATAAMLGTCYGNSDMNPLKRKKLSSMLMNRDTPILRTVLGQADSSQPVSLVCHSNNSQESNNSNGLEERPVKDIKNEPSEDAQSPYTDLSMVDEDDKPKLGFPSTSPHAYSGDMRAISGIATYVPSTQKPEWKRYKQYTRDDIMSAINAVKNGMSALQAARKYHVPSRTLYDKVKKLGITTSRPFKRGSNGSNACFPYGISGTSSPYRHLEAEEHSMNNNSALLEASSILQHALDSRGGDEREALAAMAAAAAAHAAISGHSTSPNNTTQARSPSPSPTLLKYMRINGLTPSPAPGSEHNHSETNGSSERDREEEDEVEDLSVARKQESRVIMPPMNMSSIIVKEEMLKETLREELRREVSVENAE